MKKIGMILIVACLVYGVSASGARAFMGGGKGMGIWDGDHAMFVIKALGLDDAQTKEVKAILFKTQKEMVQKRAAIQVARIELREMLGKDQVDIKAADAKVKQIASLGADAAILHIQAMEDVKAKLTPEQKKKLAEMMDMVRMKFADGFKDCPMMKGRLGHGMMDPGDGGTPPEN